MHCKEFTLFCGKTSLHHLHQFLHGKVHTVVYKGHKSVLFKTFENEYIKVWCMIGRNKEKLLLVPTMKSLN